MSAEDALWCSVENNPHCLQALLNGSKLTELERDIPFSRQLLPDSPALPYRRRRNESKTVIHWGQRKLLLSEMEFLNNYGHLSSLVVYAGAAPGTHLNYLVDAFPSHRFVCVDPARFSIRPHARIEIRNELFTDEMAREFERARCLFICDIRSADSSSDCADEVEVHVESDMLAQQQWHKLMKPVKSLLKFRLPWSPGATSYLDGDVYFQAFAPITSTETRLIPFDDNKMKAWENKKYEDQLFYFNTRARPAVYNHSVQGSGLDHCYDCISEITILMEWILKNEPDLGSSELNERVAEESLCISRSLDTQRTLESGNTDPGLRQAGIIQRQCIDGRPAYRVHTEARGFAVSEAINISQKRELPSSLSCLPSKAQRVSNCNAEHCVEGVCDAAHLDASGRISSSVNRFSEAASHHCNEDTMYPHHDSPTNLSVMDETQKFHSHAELSRCDASDHFQSEHTENSVKSHTQNYHANKVARFDVEKYSKMLGIDPSSAVNSNYSVTAGSTNMSTKGLGFSGARPPTSVHGRDKPSVQVSKPCNAHLFPEISSFQRWLSVYLYSRFMQGPSRFLDLSLRSYFEILDALTYCKPSVYIHGHIKILSESSYLTQLSIQEQEDVMRRFSSVLMRGFSLNFSGKDGNADLLKLCSDCRTISEIDIVDLGFMESDSLKSISSLVAVLESFDAVCAPLSMMQGRTNCGIDEFTRSLPIFSSKGWRLLSWSTVERYAIKFRSSRTILPSAVNEIRDCADQGVFLMQYIPMERSVSF